MLKARTTKKVLFEDLRSHSGWYLCRRSLNKGRSQTMKSLVGNGKYFKFNFLVQSEANEDSQEQVYYGRVLAKQ